MTTLFVDGRGLKKMPPSLFRYTNLERLYLCNNYFATIERVGVSFSLFVHLRYLDLSRCQVTCFFRVKSNGHFQVQYLCSDIAQCSQLAALVVSKNILTSIPDWVTSLSRLESLHMNGNLLKSMGCVYRMTHLTLLDLNNNLITSLPSSVTDLTKLLFLDLRRNKFPDGNPYVFGKDIQLSLSDLSQFFLKRSNIKTAMCCAYLTLVKGIGVTKDVVKLICAYIWAHVDDECWLYSFT